MEKKSFKLVILNLLFLTVSLFLGSAIAQSENIVPANNSTIPEGEDVVVTWSDSGQYERNFIMVGTTGSGSRDVLWGGTGGFGNGRDNTVIINKEKLSGISTLYVRLYWNESDTGWKYNDLTYTIGSTSNNSPDYKIQSKINKFIFDTGAQEIKLLVKIEEINNGENTGDLVVRVDKNEHMTLTLNPELYALSVMGTPEQILSNSEWEISETAFEYELRYIGNGKVFPPNTTQYLGLVGVFSTDNGEDGNFQLYTTIRRGSGDINQSNNHSKIYINY